MQKMNEIFDLAPSNPYVPPLPWKSMTVPREDRELLLALIPLNQVHIPFPPNKSQDIILMECRDNFRGEF